MEMGRSESESKGAKLKLIGYLRVSTARQREGYSLDHQKEAIERYCQARGYELVAVEEESESAIKARPVFQRVKAQVLEGKADGLIVAKLDRLGRSVRDLANIAEELSREGKQLISVGDSIDTSSSNGKLLFHILSAIAEYERELLIERTKAGRALAEKQGKICHRPRKEIDPKVLREMKAKDVSHRMMAKILGVSRATILKRLDELGLR
ncbi:TPA: recombinase family protein [Candidatus Poribacteria bacterium]|nr:recombinase family protein [Candidatus Poribacteria bacterium]